MSRKADIKLFSELISKIANHPGTGGKVLRSFSLDWQPIKEGGFSLNGYTATWKFPKTKKK